MLRTASTPDRWPAATAWWHHEAVADRRSAAAGPVTIADVRAWAMALPRTEEHLIRDYVKFRIGRIVYATVSPDETILGFGFPKEERAALIAAEPDKFLLERRSDARYNWIDARMATLGRAETHEFITDAWRMVVPRRLAAQYQPERAGRTSRPAAAQYQPERAGRTSRPAAQDPAAQGRGTQST